jgi:hypothetical protein
MRDVQERAGVLLGGAWAGQQTWVAWHTDGVLGCAACVDSSGLLRMQGGTGGKQ